MDNIEYKNIQIIKDYNKTDIAKNFTKGMFGTNIPLWVFVLAGFLILKKK